MSRHRERIARERMAGASEVVSAIEKIWREQAWNGRGMTLDADKLWPLVEAAQAVERRLTEEWRKASNRSEG